MVITTDLRTLDLPALHSLKHQLGAGALRSRVEAEISRKAGTATPAVATPSPAPPATATKSTRARSRDVEHREQAALFDKAEDLLPRYPDLALMFAVPNGGNRDPRVARKLKAEGVKPGVLDVWLPVARGRFIGCVTEMKAEYVYPHPDGHPRDVKGKTSAEQDWWIERLRAAGHFVQVCWNAGDALAGILAYLDFPAHAEAVATLEDHP